MIEMLLMLARKAGLFCSRRWEVKSLLGGMAITSVRLYLNSLLSPRKSILIERAMGQLLFRSVNAQHGNRYYRYLATLLS